MKVTNHNPEASPDHSIGRCDGRCVLLGQTSKKERKEKKEKVRSISSIGSGCDRNCCQTTNVPPTSILYSPKGRDVINAVVSKDRGWGHEG